MTFISAPTIKLLLNLIAPQDPGDLSYNEIEEKHMAHFKPKTLKIVKCFCFNKQYQGRKMKLLPSISQN